MNALAAAFIITTPLLSQPLVIMTTEGEFFQQHNTCMISDLLMDHKGKAAISLAHLQVASFKRAESMCLPLSVRMCH